MIGLGGIGLIAYALLPIAGVPQIDIPTIQVSARLPGASADTMATSVAAPLERQLALISGVAARSYTSARGQTSITVEFDLSRTVDGAALDVQTAINAAGGQLPKDLPDPPTYEKINPADALLMSIAVTSTANAPKGTLDGPKQSLTLDATDQLFDAASFNSVIIAYRNGAPVHVGDIGVAVDGVEDVRQGAWLGN
jgi:multidrug efflux pump subunit AcrB